MRWLCEPADGHHMSQTTATQYEQGVSTTGGSQQSAGQQQSFQTGRGQQDAGRLPQQYRQVLNSVAQSVQVCGWCADQCVKTADPNMIECIRMCEDVVELGETLLAVAPRSSRFTADIARTFQQAAQACAQECGKHSQSHCQECASVLSQTAPTVQQLSTQQQGGQLGQQPPAAGSQQFSQ